MWAGEHMGKAENEKCAIWDDFVRHSPAGGRG